MKSPVLTLIFLGALGSAHAAITKAAAPLSLAQNMGSPQLAVALNTVSSESSPANRAKLPMQAAQSAENSPAQASGFELESGLVLALAGVMALLVVGSRRMPR
ncbi:MAG TPA: hypothetical protein VLA16_18165 [Ideonella sp.]|nr:hypothetical protein [Ideonella sp.]